MKKTLFLFLLIIPVITLTGCDRKINDEISGENYIFDISDNSEVGCNSACDNYVEQCLTLVPGATQQLYVDGFDSCLGERVSWSSEKIDCIEKSQNCTWMTDECGL